MMNPSVDVTNNRLNGYGFHASGNTKIDAEGRTFIYDSENKQTEVRDQANTIVGQYFYNGDGQRIRKVVPATGETTVFVYDASNKLVAEYSTVVEPPATAKTSYLTSDHLGSPRITTDQFGQVASRRDFMPFGEEIFRAGYGSDSVRQKFTAYERDNENGLDFAQNRYYSYSHGRFTSPDPLLASANAINPKTWNRYAYVLNNPTNFVDPLGLSPECPPGQNCFYNPSNQLVYLDGDGVENVVDESTPPAMGFFDPNAVPRTVVNPAAPAAATGSTVAATVGSMLAYGVAALATIALLPQTVQAPGLPARPDEEEKKDPSGMATINYYKSGALQSDLQAPHYSITVTYQGQSTTTELGIGSNNTAVIGIDPLNPAPNMSVNVPLPNAQAAQMRQGALLGQSVGTYERNTNSCATHVLDILRAGGYPIRGPNSFPTATREVFRPLGIPIR